MAEKKKALKSGNPAKRAEAKASSASDFKKNRGGVITLPSGLAVKANRAGGLRAFVEVGTIPNSLMGIIDDAVKGGKKPDMSTVITEEGIDAQMLEDMIALTDAVTCKVVVEPKVYPVPENESDRDDERLYVDEIEDEDKMFIFQWVTGGTTSVERFRQESASTLDDLAGRAVLGSPAE